MLPDTRTPAPKVPAPTKGKKGKGKSRAARRRAAKASRPTLTIQEETKTVQKKASAPRVSSAAQKKGAGAAMARIRAEGPSLRARPTAVRAPVQAPEGYTAGPRSKTGFLLRTAAPPKPSKLALAAQFASKQTKKVLGATKWRPSSEGIAPKADAAPEAKGALARTKGGIAGIGAGLGRGIKIGAVAGIASTGNILAENIKKGGSALDIANRTAKDVTERSLKSAAIGFGLQAVPFVGRGLARLSAPALVATAGRDVAATMWQGYKAGTARAELTGTVKAAQKAGLSVTQDKKGFWGDVGRALIGQAPTLEVKDTAYSRAITESARQRAERDFAKKAARRQRRRMGATQ